MEQRLPLPKYLAQANRLIAALPVETRALFLEHCELVILHRQDVLSQSGQDAEHTYFPIDCFVSVILKLEDANAVQVGLTGNEGMVNLSLILGMRVATLTSVVQSAGRAFRIRHNEIQELLHANQLLGDVLYKYIALRMDQLTQNLACVSSHTVEQRLARWLLIARDCAHSRELAFTHEGLALMLGVRRERVRPIASLLQKRGLITYSRGDITLLDETRLKAAACSCYQTDLAAYESVLGTETFDLSL